MYGEIMKRITFAMFCLLVCINTLIGQQLWPIKLNASMYADVGNHTDAPYLKQALLSRRSFGAAYLLAYYHTQAEKNFLLDNLRVWAYEDPFPIGMFAYYRYQLIRGFLGEQGAITGMDSLAQNIEIGEPMRLDAIQSLAYAGHYNYYNYVMSVYNRADDVQDDAIEILGLYGRSSQYSSVVRSTLESYIRSHSNLLEYAHGINALASFDKPYTVQLLDELFRTSFGNSRYDYFYNLQTLDPNGQPERTMWAVPLESNESLRYNYYPHAGGVLYKNSSLRYLEPFYIKFAYDRTLVELTNSRYELLRFVYHFVPAVPSLSKPVIELLDTLISHKHQVSSYGWVANSTFVNELETHLTSARSFLVAGDSANCARQLLIFQKKVNEEYADSLDGDARTVTREGWKFLFYESQYVLDRLPNLTSLKVSMPADYSMVSVPVDVAYFYKPTVFPRSTSAASMFKRGVGYVPKDTLANGIGYWLKYTVADTASFYGLKTTATSVAVDTGWNLIGSLSQDIAKNKVQPQGVTILSSYFGYQKGIGYFIADTLKSGRGYWVNVAERGSLLLGGNYAGGGTGTEQPPPPPGSPSTPVLQSPANAATNIAVTVTLSWYPASGASTYQLQVATDTLFAGLVFNQSGLTSTSRQVGPLSYNTNYYWRVNATNASGTSYWSDRWRFTTLLPPSAPPAPTLQSPANFATGVSVSPVVSWNTASTATSYRVQVSTSSSFSTVTQDYSGITITAKVLATLANNTTYYWRVNASNSAGTSAWSASWRFTTESGGSSCGTYSSVQSMDQFTVKDSRGNSQKLYAHNRKRALALDVSDLSMPPEPPPGMFSVRFQSDKFVEGLQPNQPTARIPIKVRDAEFPVTLEWDINDQNKIRYWLVVPGKGQNRIPMTGKGSRTINDSSSGVIIIEASASVPCNPD